MVGNVDSIRLRQIIENTCIYLFFFLTVVIFLYNYNTYIFYFRLGIMAIGAFLGFCYCFEKKGLFYYPLLFLLLIIVCWIICFIFQDGYNNYPSRYMIYTILYLGLSILLFKNNYNHKATILLFLFLVFSLLLRLVLVSDINNVLLATSRNYVSVLLLLALLFYYVSCHDKKKTASIIPAIISFAICLYFKGRGGIVAMGFLLLALIIYRLKKMHNRTYRNLLVIFAIVICIIIGMVLLNTNVHDGDDSFFSYFSRFEDKGIVDADRTEYWGKFFLNNSASLDNFLLGSNVLLIRPDGNLHNSFLQSYASFGLIGFIAIIVLIIKAIIYGIKMKDGLWIVLFVSLIIRAFTDQVLFQGYCEVFLYYFAFYWLIRGRIQKEDHAISNRID